VAHRIKRRESVREAFARCTREQLDGAVRALSEDIQKDPVEAVHSARKAVKKERALLRLMRGVIPSEQRHHENAALREAARGLSDAREREVVVQTIDQLAGRFSGQLPARTFATVRERLAVARDAHRAGLVSSTRGAQAVQDLGAVRVRFDDMKLKVGGWSALDQGLVRTYRRGRNALVLARGDRSPETMHAWRKRVKDLWYHLRVLTPVCGPSVRGQAKEADRLAELLGDDHDLAVLKVAVEDIGDELPLDLVALFGLIDHRREQLQSEAIPIGERLYAEKPKAFRRRMHRSWRAGRALALASSPAPGGVVRR
jgi:CHAD domain-containing protein